jgi:hypothetical protein
LVITRVDVGAHSYTKDVTKSELLQAQRRALQETFAV